MRLPSKSKTAIRSATFSANLAELLFAPTELLLGVPAASAISCSRMRRRNCGRKPSAGASTRSPVAPFAQTVDGDLFTDRPGEKK